MLWRSKVQPTPVFLPGKIQGREGLVRCCLWGRTESDMTEGTQQQQQQQQHIYMEFRKMVMINPVCKTAKETQMYRTDFWTLWERERVG